MGNGPDRLIVSQARDGTAIHECEFFGLFFYRWRCDYRMCLCRRVK